VTDAISRAIDTLRYPADDPTATAVIALAVVVLGLLVAVVLMAFASPGRKASSRQVSGADPVDSFEAADGVDCDA
jgi:hypothetical protein